MSWVEFARASALVTLLSIGCAGATPDQGSRRAGVDGQPRAAAGAGGAAPTGGGAFGNPTRPTAPVAQPGGGSGAAGTGSGACQVGVFCAPTSPDPDNCGTLRLEADIEVTRTPGNLLVIFDQSGSMDQPWMSGSKLDVASGALVAALTPLQDVMTAGAIFFPSVACVPFLPPPPGGAVQPIEGPNQIPFQPGPQFLAALNQHWTSGRFIGDMIGTPMQEAFDRADVAIQNAMLTGPLAVVAFTDGEPNCFTDPMLTMVPTATEPERAASWLTDRQIKTYMVGLPGAQGVQILDQVAMSGGTMTYILPDDPAALEAKLREVVEETVRMGFDSCSINLTPAADVPDELLMIVEEPGVGEQQVPRDRGWTLSPDGAHVEIMGSLCEAAMGGRFNSITFEYACPDSPPPPALPPID